MSRAYRSARDHLDDLVELAGMLLQPPGAGGAAGGEETAARAEVERHLERVRLEDLIDQRVEATRAAGAELPFGRLCSAFELTPTEVRCLRLLVGLEVSSRARGFLEGGAATLEDLDRLVYAPSVRDRFAIELALGGRLFAYALVEWADDDRRSRFGRAVRASARVVDLAFGRVELADEVAACADLAAPARSWQHLLVPAEAKSTVLEAMRARAERGAVPLIVGPRGSGRRSLATGAAHELGANVLTVRCADLAADRFGAVVAAIQREAILFGAAVVLADAEHLQSDAATARRSRAAALDAAFASFPGALAATASAGLTAPLFPSRGMVLVELGVPAETERADLWRRSLPTTTPANVIAEVAARYAVTGGTIATASRAAAARSIGRAVAPTTADAHLAIRTTLDSELATLGVRLDWRQTWDDFVLPDDSRDELRELIARVRHRRHVLETWGFARKVAKGLGLPVLFSGPPGTGKTMAAGLIAAELGLDLYQIDLSRLVSKYVGETEKNLAQVFDAAEAGHAILLFDEADSLFAKRTEVKSSVDRYANLEVNYLLQRMESFTGITILTTNFDASIDEAFRRRLAFRISFPMPDEDERERLWRAVIPAEAALAPGIDFPALARRFEMSGGYIKNAALRAAFLAAADGGPITMLHLSKAATAEYASMGKLVSHHGVTSGRR
jgi:SpoVK/Ycf46/Vps4 family AAA+-type ATPase